MEQVEQLARIKDGISEEKRLFLGWLEDPRVHGNVSKALLVSGIKRTTVYRWRKEDNDFAQRWDIIVQYANEVVADIAEYKLYQMALGGNVRAQIFILKNLRPERWNVRPFCNNCKNRLAIL